LKPPGLLGELEKARREKTGEMEERIKIKSKIMSKSKRSGYSTVTAIRNGAELLIAETKSKVMIFTPGRGLSRVFR